MGVSTHIVGVRDLDGRFEDMLAIKRACDAAEVEYPAAVEDYFGEPECSEDGLRSIMSEVDIEDAVTQVYLQDSTDTWEVDLSKLSDEIKAIRFNNSY